MGQWSVVSGGGHKLRQTLTRPAARACSVWDYATTRGCGLCARGGSPHRRCSQRQWRTAPWGSHGGQRRRDVQARLAAIRRLRCAVQSRCQEAILILGTSYLNILQICEGPNREVWDVLEGRAWKLAVAAAHRATFRTALCAA